MTLIITVDVDFTEEETIRILEEKTPTQPVPRDENHVLTIRVGTTDKEYKIDSGDEGSFTMIMIPKK